MNQLSMRMSSAGINVGPGERVGSVVLGALLLIEGVRRQSPWGVLAALSGGALLYRGASGHCAVREALEERHQPVERRLANAPEAASVERSMTIAGSPQELYEFWRNPTNLSRIMSPTITVDMLSASRTHWRLSGPLGRTLEWDTTLIEDRPSEYLSWRSDEDAAFATEGSIGFRAAPGDRGTVTTFRFRFDPPAGPLGDVVVSAFEGIPRKLASDVLRRFKSLVEAGEIPTLERNSSARTPSLVRRGLGSLTRIGDSDASLMLERG